MLPPRRDTQLTTRRFCVIMATSSYTAEFGAGVVVNGLDLNTDATKVLVGGRKVLKVLRIEEKQFSEVCNLRIREMVNLSYSATDVAWSPLEENVVASAATNGVIITWDLNKPGRNKQDYFISHHTRTCNRITFHYNEPNLLLTGSQDGSVALIDVRSRSVSNVYSDDSPVRDVQLDPHTPANFATACEDGNIRLWDTRVPNRRLQRFSAHYGPAFSIDWHPTERWLATGGRDKMIRIFDSSADQRHIDTPIFTVQSIASTARVKWRPQWTFHLSSCAQLLDFSLNVWDIRRPYIPVAVFSRHKDVVTGIAWKGSNPGYVLTSGKDSCLCLHEFSSADEPLNKVSPVAVSIGPSGRVAHAFNNKLAQSTGRVLRNNNLPKVARSFVRGSADLSDHSVIMSSHMCVYKADSDAVRALSMDWFVESALGYRLSGEPTRCLCEHNANVASRLSRSQVAQTWRLLRLMCPSSVTTFSASHTVPSQPPTVCSLPASLPLTDTDVVGSLTDNTTVDYIDTAVKPPHVVVSIDKKALDIPTGISEEEDESGGCDEDDVTSLMNGYRHGVMNGKPLIGGTALTLSQAIARCNSLTDILFGDSELLTSVCNTSCQSDDYDDHNEGDWQLPAEAFELRLDADDAEVDGMFEMSSTSASDRDLCNDSCVVNDWLTNDDDDHSGTDDTVDVIPSVNHRPTVGKSTTTTLTLSVTESPMKQEILNTAPYFHTVPTSLDFTSLIVDLVHQYASQNDVQMAVCLLLCLGDKYIHLIDDQLLQQWFLSYVELLHSFELWSVAAEVIKLSPAVTEVHSLSCISTRLVTSCSQCGKVHNRTGWVCERCNNYIHCCAICHLPVKGVYIWCHGCAHGGHLSHITSWFDNHQLCPAGCGHCCEFS